MGKKINDKKPSFHFSNIPLFRSFLDSILPFPRVTLTFAFLSTFWRGNLRGKTKNIKWLELKKEGNLPHFMDYP